VKPSDIENISNAYKIITEDLGLGPMANDQSSVSFGVNMPDSNATKDYGSEAVEMASSEVKSVIKNALNVLAELQKSSDVEPWVAAKVTLATDYIQTVADWLSNQH
jgi:hypothetical protein